MGDLRTNFTMKTTSYKTIFTRIHPSTHTFANSDILELKNKKMKKITPKKSSLFSILFFLELLSENPEEPNHQDPQNHSNPNISFASIQWECSTSCYRCQPFFAQELCRLPKNLISVVGWNRQARLNGSPGVQHPHNVNQASEKTSKLPLAY